MKKLNLIFILCVLSILIFKNSLALQRSTKSSTRFQNFSNDTLINQLSTLDLLQFQGQSVDTLLAHLPNGYITMKIGGWRSQRIAEVLYIIYPNKVSVGIHVRSFQYMNPHLTNTSNPKQNWDINLFRQEAITFTIIFNDTTCINGCENRNK